MISEENEDAQEIAIFSFGIGEDSTGSSRGKLSVIIKSFPKRELYSVQWKDDLANAATLDAVSFQNTMVKKKKTTTV